MRIHTTEFNDFTLATYFNDFGFWFQTIFMSKDKSFKYYIITEYGVMSK